MDLGVEPLGECHEDVLIAKHTTLKMDNAGWITAQPAGGGEEGGREREKRGRERGRQGVERSEIEGNVHPFLQVKLHSKHTYQFDSQLTPWTHPERENDK